MSDGAAAAQAAREYAAAYAAHDSERDPTVALQLYRELIVAHAGARVAGYSRTQVRNIVDAVVPEQEPLDAHLELVLASLGPRTL